MVVTEAVPQVRSYCGLTGVITGAPFNLLLVEWGFSSQRHESHVVK
jgi:hypothetical protein